MPKVSRPVIYTALAAVAAYALVLNTQPDKPAAKHVPRAPRTTKTADADGVLPEDLKAHFPRYTGGNRDPFVPGVVIARPKLVKATAKSSPLASGKTGWALTGINSVNGVASALIENGATGESVFLQPGDRWNGLRVVSIKPDRVLFQNGLGHQDTLTFAAPPEDKTGAPATPGAVSVPSAPRLPNTALSLPPYPVSPLRVQSLSRGAALPQLPPLSGAPAVQEDFPPPPGPPPNGE